MRSAIFKRGGMMLIDLGPWLATKDGDPRAFALFRRHYSFVPYADGRRSDPGYRNRFQFVGPGEKLVLVTSDYSALFVWRKFIDDSGQKGVNCAVFRNEGRERSSELILAAEESARARWPGERMYTYVNARRLLSSHPGYCFLCAGWRRIGRTKGGLIVLEK
jgi:hypothetical protein